MPDLSDTVAKCRIGTAKKFYTSIASLSHTSKKCRACILRSICPNCFGANYAATGNIYQRDNNMCRLTKITMKARSFFRAKQWESGQLHLTPTEEQLLLRAIIRIQEELEV